MKLLMSKVQVQLRVVGAQFASSGLNVDCRPWSEESEVREIQNFDIGIMPLSDSPWERGKCGYKLIQYMACGRPVVSSPVGVNTTIVEHGVNGFLAATPDDWSRYLKVLQENPELRRRMGVKGRRKVEKNYCLAVTAPRLASLLRKAAKEGLNVCAA
jgi:glycosyltransferase involved in cell wall biosynthesis